MILSLRIKRKGVRKVQGLVAHSASPFYPSLFPDPYHRITILSSKVMLSCLCRVGIYPYDPPLYHRPPYTSTISKCYPYTVMAWITCKAWKHIALSYPYQYQPIPIVILFLVNTIYNKAYQQIISRSPCKIPMI